MYRVVSVDLSLTFGCSLLRHDIPMLFTTCKIIVDITRHWMLCDVRRSPEKINLRANPLARSPGQVKLDSDK